MMAIPGRGARHREVIPISEIPYTANSPGSTSQISPFWAPFTCFFPENKSVSRKSKRVFGGYDKNHDGYRPSGTKRIWACLGGGSFGGSPLCTGPKKGRTECVHDLLNGRINEKIHVGWVWGSYDTPT